MRRWRGPGLAVRLSIGVLAALLATGCGATPTAAPRTTASGGGANPDTSLAAAAGQARLDPCPPSATTGQAVNRLPDVTLDCLGTAGAAPVRLAGVSGPAVVNVWGSWCGPCREEAPLLQRLHAAAGARLTVLGVDYEDADVPALAFAAEQDLHYPSVTDPEGDFPLRQFAAGPPVTLFVDAAGAVVHVRRGPFQTWDELRGLVERHLGVTL